MAADHEKPVALGPAEGEVGHPLWHQDAADHCPVGREGGEFKGMIVRLTILSGGLLAYSCQVLHTRRREAWYIGESTGLIQTQEVF